MRKDQFLIGVYYGTDSVCAGISNANTVHGLAPSVCYYPRHYIFCNSTVDQFRKHPLDYIESLKVVKDYIKFRKGQERADETVEDGLHSRLLVNAYINYNH